VIAVLEKNARPIKSACYCGDPIGRLSLSRRDVRDSADFALYF